MDQSTALKSAFVTPSGVYQWNRMPFGLINAPSSCQHLLTTVLKGLNYQRALVYVDDMLAFSSKTDSHIRLYTKPVDN